MNFAQDRENISEDELDRLFSALSDRTRRKILARLSEKDASVSDLAEPFDMSLPAILKHLKVLEEAGLLVQEKTGRVRRCHFEGKRMRMASDWLAQYRLFWEDKFDALESYLDSFGDTEDKS